MKWIDVEQELPLTRRPFLTYRDGYYEVAVYRFASSERWETHNGLVLDGVTHWMHLPDGPEPGPHRPACPP